MKQPTGATVGNIDRLAYLFELARLDAQRPGNIGAGIRVMEMLMNRADFRPRNGGRA